MSISEGNQERIQVLVADSNRTQSQLLTRALRRQPSMVVRNCGSGLDHCLEALRSASADVMVLDNYVSDSHNQIDTIRGLKSSSPGVRIILSVDDHDRNLVVDALLAGAQGVFCRADQSFRALCRCIEVVYRGEFWVSNEQLSYVVEALRGGVQRRVVNAKDMGLLTPREEQVASLVAGGSVNREIAQLLGVKENTVKKSLLRIYDKLGVSNRVELVLYVLTHQRASRPAGVGTIVGSPGGTPRTAELIDHNLQSARSVA